MYFVRHPKHPIADFTVFDPESYEPLLYALWIVQRYDRRQRQYRFLKRIYQ